MAVGNSLLTAMVGIFTYSNYWDSLAENFHEKQNIRFYRYPIFLYFFIFALVIYWIRVKIPRIIPRGFDLRVAGVAEEDWVWCEGCGMDRPPLPVV